MEQLGIEGKPLFNTQYSISRSVCSANVNFRSGYYSNSIVNVRKCFCKRHCVGMLLSFLLLLTLALGVICSLSQVTLCHDSYSRSFHESISFNLTVSFMTHAQKRRGNILTSQLNKSGQVKRLGPYNSVTPKLRSRD